ncbi:MAG: DinB family protein [Acidobacteria bacterium]|nr:DinB family protein [Acidobacteriota bacterium]
MDEINLRFSVARIAAELRDSLQQLEWVVGLIPANWHYRQPNGQIRGLSDEKNRSPAVHIAHLALYEELLANPVLAELSEGRDGTRVASSGHVSWMLPQVEALAQQPLSEILERLRHARAEHIRIVQRFDDASFNRPLTRLWSTGESKTRLESAGWAAAKTVQHTGEHANMLFRFALFHTDEY